MKGLFSSLYMYAIDIDRSTGNAGIMILTDGEQTIWEVRVNNG
ncbi:hypothetical protein ASZ90_019546 [hydrocarbon metagenome]|uniref:Uncharacterized protein n=1 Tax=hydrocarbon metagenome TaxID=938273 RepID=A0A0W8E3R4_9ZZZZ